MFGRLIFKDGTEIEGKSFGFEKPAAGELVFSTGMVGYPESLTDPSYFGQILTFTYPLIGNYGVPEKKYWESSGIKVSGLIVSQYIDTPSHFSSQMSLGDWLKQEKIPALQVGDTRFITKKLRSEGNQLAKIVFFDCHCERNEVKRSNPATDKRLLRLLRQAQDPRNDISFDDPNKKNLVDMVSTKKVLVHPCKGRPCKEEDKTIVLIDCGVKENIRRSLLARGVRLITVPWDFDILTLQEKFNGVIISNGPGDPKMLGKTIDTVRKILKRKIPILGICLGNQILALAAAGDTYKLKFGHRGQNQPCIQIGTKRCFLTTQNHGFAVGKIPPGFKPWFINANDQTNEGIIHEKLPFMSVQFHPEAAPGPTDTGWVFDKFLNIKC